MSNGPPPTAEFPLFVGSISVLQQIFGLDKIRQFAGIEPGGDIDTVRVKNALSIANDTAASYLSRRYRLQSGPQPFPNMPQTSAGLSGQVPPMLIYHVAQLFRWYLINQRQDVATTLDDDLYKRALTYLEDVASGKIDLESVSDSDVLPVVAPARATQVGTRETSLSGEKFWRAYDGGDR